MYIKKIKLHNYRRFKDIEIPFKEGRNILVGDNESGKSSVLEAIDLTARGSRHRVEDIGIETLFNVDVIKEFMAGDKQLANLPEYQDVMDFMEKNHRNPSRHRLEEHDMFNMRLKA